MGDEEPAFGGFSLLILLLLAVIMAAAAACLLALTATGRVASCTARGADCLVLSVLSLLFSFDFDPEHACPMIAVV